MSRRLKRKKGHLIGIISDTHGLMRPEVVKALEGVELIIHAGDVGKAEILAALQAIAPVVAVRGNTDRGVWAGELAETERVEIGQCSLYVLHDIQQLNLDPAAAGFHAVISGHSHHPSIEERKGVLFLNPGSAGPRRFKLPICVALLHLEGKSFKAKLVELMV